MKPCVVKPSKIDLQAPAHVEVIYALLVHDGGRSIPRVVFQDTNPKIVQEMSDAMAKRHEPHKFATYWHHKETKRRLNKMFALKNGTTRRFLVTVPWSPEISQEGLAAGIQSVLELEIGRLQPGAKVTARPLSETETIEKKPSEAFLTVPVLEKFDSTKLIGTLKIARSALPPLPNYCFNIGYRHTQQNGLYELIAVSIVNDIDYMAFVNSTKGKMQP